MKFWNIEFLHYVKNALTDKWTKLFPDVVHKPYKLLYSWTYILLYTWISHVLYGHWISNLMNWTLNVWKIDKDLLKIIINQKNKNITIKKKKDNLKKNRFSVGWF